MPEINGSSGLISNTLAVNGIHLRGSIRELKEGVKLDDAVRASRNDGIDQVFVESGGKNYVIQGDGLDLKGFKQLGLTKTQLVLANKSVDANVLAVDNEKNTAAEGWWNLGTKAGVAGVGLALLLGSGNKTGSAAVKATAMAVGVALSFTGGAAAIGAYRTAHQGQDGSRLNALLK